VNQLGDALEVIEDEDAVPIGQMQTRRHQRGAGALIGAFGGDCGVDGGGLLLFFRGSNGTGGFSRGRGLRTRLMLLIPFVGSGPVDQVPGDLLPLGALGAVVADAVTVDFPLRCDLVRAVFEDEALAAEVLRGGGGLESGEEVEGRSWGEDQHQEPKWDETAHRFPLDMDRGASVTR